MKRLKSLIGLALGMTLFVGACEMLGPEKYWVWGGADGKLIETIPGITFADPFPWAGEFTGPPEG